jgi:hypothetical protein
MSDPLIPNYKRGVGRLSTDRFDFEDHIQGNNFIHKANSIDVFPTLVIGTTTASNVQQALEQLLTIAQPPEIIDATTTNKGIIQLSGDISGTATNISVTRIQGRAVSTLSPSHASVLTWDGYSNIWYPAETVNAFNAAGDLSGNNILQNVIGVSGTQYDAGIGLVLRASNAVTNYTINLNPLITQTSQSDHGLPTTIRAQSSIGAGKNGGSLILSGGAPGTSGLRGSVKLQLTTSIPTGYPTTAITPINSFNMIQLAEPAAGRRVLSLCCPSDLTIFDMPANTGDMVVYLRNAASIPTTGSPSNGVLMYSSGGQLWVKQQDSNNFSVGSIPNPSVWGSSGQQTYTSKNYVQSSTSGALAFSFNLPDQTATKVDVMFVGKQIGSNNSAQFNLSMGYTRHLSPPAAVGSITNADPRVTAGASSWNIPSITVSGNTLQVFTGYSSSATIQWLVITQLTLSSSS